MARFDLPELTGARVPFRFKSDTPDQTITVWAHPPTPEEIAAAMRDAGLRFDDKGVVQLENPLDSAPRMAQAHVLLSHLCIESVENLDGWPSQCRQGSPDGLERLTPAAQALMPRVVCKHIGTEMIKQSEVSPEQGEL